MKLDNNMIERPNCGNSKCTNKGLILVSNTVLCGVCYNKLIQKQNEAIMGFIEE